MDLYRRETIQKDYVLPSPDAATGTRHSAIQYSLGSGSYVRGTSLYLPLYLNGHIDRGFFIEGQENVAAFLEKTGATAQPPTDGEKFPRVPSLEGRLVDVVFLVEGLSRSIQGILL